MPREHAWSAMHRQLRRPKRGGKHARSDTPRHLRRPKRGGKHAWSVTHRHPRRPKRDGKPGAQRASDAQRPRCPAQGAPANRPPKTGDPRRRAKRQTARIATGPSARACRVGPANAAAPRREESENGSLPSTPPRAADVEMGNCPPKTADPRRGAKRLNARIAPGSSARAWPVGPSNAAAPRRETSKTESCLALRLRPAV